MQRSQESLRVVVIGGGFAGLEAAKGLAGRRGIEVTLVDRRNFHLFQPLLYQVATGGLSPGDIASPLRSVLSRAPNVRVLKAEVRGIDVAGRRVLLDEDALPYDRLVLATGASHHYFGNAQWGASAPGLKTVEDALEMRRRIFQAFEDAEREPDPEHRQHRMTFLVVGGGPTGIELAGAIGELATTTLRRDFRAIRPQDSRILLVEGAERVLPGFPAVLSAAAERALGRLGVTVLPGTLVADIQGDRVSLRTAAGEVREVRAGTVLWAAGVAASGLGGHLAAQSGAALDTAGRVHVTPELTVPGHPEVMVLGDLAHFAHQGGTPLPGLAPVAIQQGRYAGRLIARQARGRATRPFRYRDKGSVAVIGRNAAVAVLPGLRLSGFVAWVIWALVHIRYLIGFDNKLLVLLQWGIDYLTRKRGARLITGAWSPPADEERQAA